MSKHINRRSLLGAIPVFAATSATALAMTTSAQDPHVAWLQEFRKADAHSKAQVEDTPEEKAAEAERERLCVLLAQTKATTFAGLAAQFAWFREDLGYIFNDQVGDQYAGVIDLIDAGFKEAA